jgi:hypothetical protein
MGIFIFISSHKILNASFIFWNSRHLACNYQMMIIFKLEGINKLIYNKIGKCTALCVIFMNPILDVLDIKYGKDIEKRMNEKNADIPDEVCLSVSGIFSSL